MMPSIRFAASPIAAPSAMCIADQQAAPATTAGRNLRYGSPDVPAAAGVSVRTTGRNLAKNTAHAPRLRRMSVALSQPSVPYFWMILVSRSAGPNRRPMA
jgi:hypothetical protein